MPPGLLDPRAAKSLYTPPVFTRPHAEWTTAAVSSIDDEAHP